MVWVSRWVWIMSALNLAMVIMLGYIILKIVPSSVEREMILADRDRAMQERDQVIRERDQAFASRNSELDIRYNDMTSRFDHAMVALAALEAKLETVSDDQKRFRVILGAQTDTFNAAAIKFEELINELKN